MKKLFYILSAFIIIQACNKHKHPDYYTLKTFSFEDAPFSKKLTGHKLDIEGIVYPRRILNLKKYLVVSEHKADTSIHIIDKEKMEVINKVGVIGRGPGEIGFPWNLYPAEKADEFWVYSLSKKMSKLNATSKDPFVVQNIDLTNEMRLSSGFVFSSDSTSLQTLVDGNSKFVEFDNSGNRINSYDTWGHMEDKDLPPNIVSSLYSGMLNVSPNKQYYTQACIKVDVLEILDKATGLVTSIRGPIHHRPYFKVDNSPGYPMLVIPNASDIYNYANTVMTEDKIYALFSGARFNQVNKTREKYCNDIFVFDYEGNVKGHYTLDKTISYLAVDEKNSKFYGLSFDNDPNVVVFDF